ncbi:recombinase family protein [Streptomyces sp. 6N106]|uniref:recombinase family protein n=1 Tax=Streptomyces sp. 6N106 TaxID=3457418 RepID=UPI003FD05C4F
MADPWLTERGVELRLKREGLTVREVWKEELSAFKAGVVREEFDSAIAAVLAGEVRHLLVWKLDRLSRRGMGQVGQVLDQFEAAGARLVAHVDGLDSSVPQHRGLFAWLAEQARSESFNTSTRTRRTKARAGLMPVHERYTDRAGRERWRATGEPFIGPDSKPLRIGEGVVTADERARILAGLRSRTSESLATGRRGKPRAQSSFHWVGEKPQPLEVDRARLDGIFYFVPDTARLAA